MMPRKKLEYYGAKYGIEKPTELRLTQEDCVRICEAVQVKLYNAKDVGGSISTLIDCVMDNPDYVKRVSEEMRSAHPDKELPEDFIAIRIADRAAEDVLRAYAN